MPEKAAVVSRRRSDVPWDPRDTAKAKHRSSTSRMAAKHIAKIETPHGLRRCFEAVIERPGRKPLVARFGGIPLRRQKTAVLSDRQPAPALTYPRKELVTRLLRGRCEICGSAEGITVHHIRELADLAQAGNRPAWAAVMAKKRRKSLVVCEACHDHIHTGASTASLAP